MLYGAALVAGLGGAVATVLVQSETAGVVRAALSEERANRVLGRIFPALLGVLVGGGVLASVGSQFGFLPGVLVGFAATAAAGAVVFGRALSQFDPRARASRQQARGRRRRLWGRCLGTPG